MKNKINKEEKKKDKERRVFFTSLFIFYLTLVSFEVSILAYTKEKIWLVFLSAMSFGVLFMAMVFILFALSHNYKKK